ncbi:TlpA disulfide reductase family protein [Occultella aeris]|uniref:Thiol-disulfide oxidoreductase ResA n=1 Tax=Occultella aeris TaxID=2761496 RepID=A0A7M4DKD0_9MICO|nr:TlpA disulfide reductase family protein [Occultella aeris]VZO37529.1 Thiol-disulfide oxidoreductase ResA [Occultella aeris]
MTRVRPAGRAVGRARLTALGLLAGALVLAGCASDPTPSTADDANQGYVSGDGSVQSWAQSDRGDVVELAGRSYAEEPIDIADWRGDVVVVNFWYAACPPCRAEAPDLAAIATDYSGQGVHLLGVNHTDDAGTAQSFERRFELPYPSLDDDDAAGVAAMQGVVPLTAMPSTVVLDAEGRVAARIIGIADPTILRGLIDDELAAGA